MRLELSTEQQAERERQRELAEMQKRRRLREELQQAQRDDMTHFEMKQKENRQLEEYQLQQVWAASNNLPNCSWNIHSNEQHQPHTHNSSHQKLLGRPYSSTGRLIFCPYCFIVFRQVVSEVRRPIAVKLYHMIGNWFD